MMKKEIEKLFKALNKKSVIPILDNILFKDGYLYFSDLTNIVKIKNPYFTHKGEFAVNGREFLKAMKFIDSYIECSFNDANVELSYSAGKISMQNKVKDDDYDAFISIDNKLSGSESSMSEKDRSNIIKSSVFTATDKLRPVMQSVYYGDGYICASDAHRMYYPKADVKGKFYTMLNTNTVMALGFMIDIKYRSGELSDLRNSGIMLYDENIEVWQRDVDGNYPNFKAVVQKDNDVKVHFSRKNVLSVAMLLSGISHTDSIIMDIKNGRIDFSAKDYDTNLSITKSIDCHNSLKKGEQINKRGVKGKFLISILKSLETDIIEMEISRDASNAIIFNNEILLTPMIITE